MKEQTSLVSNQTPAGSSQQLAVATPPPRVSEWKYFKKAFFSRRVVVAGLCILAALFFTAIFANWITPYDPYQQDMANGLAPISSQHLLGTDQFGRDTVSRLIYGSRTAIIVGFISVSVAAIIGIVLGLLAGYFGHLTSMIIMRLIDTMMSFC
jgi:ABC-type dipeptide/oligopeptide/nickel transport system permease subunit